MSGASMNHMVENFLPIFSNTCTRKLRYSGGTTILSPSGVLASQIYTLNGLYDPDITGIGHQPMGYDQVMPFYEHYHVLECNATVTFINRAAASRGFVALKITPDVALPASFDELLEEGRVCSDMLGGDGYQFNGTKVLRVKVNVPAVNGLTRRNFIASDGYRGSLSSNPAEQTYLHVAVWGSTTGMDVEVRVVLDYTAVFTEPRNLTSSYHILGDKALARKLGELKIEASGSAVHQRTH